MANPTNASAQQGQRGADKPLDKLVNLVDERQLPRFRVVSKLWQYIRRHGPFQDSIVTDDGRVLVGAEAWAELDRFIDDLQRRTAAQLAETRELVRTLRSPS